MEKRWGIEILSSVPCPNLTGGGYKKQRLNALAFIALIAVCAAGLAGCKGALGGGQMPDIPDLEDGLISLSKAEDVQFKNEKEPIPLKANLLDGILEITNLEWSMEGDSIATLTGEGEEVTVTPNGTLGEAVVTAKLVPIEGIDLGDLVLESTFKLDVIDEPVVTAAAIGDIMLKSGNTPKEKQISASFTPDTIAAYQPVFTWEFVQGSDKAEFADSSEGADVMFRAKTAGTGKVKAKLTVLGCDFYSAETAFNVLAFNPGAEPHDSITITDAPTTLIATDQSGEFSLAYEPSSALYSTISWVYDTNKLTLDYANQNKLKITPKAGSAGTYTITAKSDTSTDVKSSFTLVVQPVTVSLAFETGKPDTISKADTTKLVPTVNAKNKSLTWSSANTNAATVVEGIVTGLASKTTASVAITAKSAADVSASGSKNVSVKPPTYTLVYDKNGGAGTMTNESKTYGTVYTLKQNTYTKSGYTFAGWNTVSAGTGGTAYTDKQANVDIEPSKSGATVTLFAQWASLAPKTITSDSEWTAPVTGKYTIEVWGAEGEAGSASSTTVAVGGKGGYSKGEKISLNAGDKLTLKVGAKGGGGKGGSGASYTRKALTVYSKSGGAGGGKTEVLKDTEVLIVAGGGGGGGGEGNFASTYGKGSNDKCSGYPGETGGGYNADGSNNNYVYSGGQSATSNAHGNGGYKQKGNSGSAGGSGGNGANSHTGSDAGNMSINYNAGAGGGGGGGGYGYKNGGGGGNYWGGSSGWGGGGGSGYAKVGAGGFEKASGSRGTQAGNGKVVITFIP